MEQKRIPTGNFPYNPGHVTVGSIGNFMPRRRADDHHAASPLAAADHRDELGVSRG
jgi:hypothetical protein